MTNLADLLERLPHLQDVNVTTFGEATVDLLYRVAQVPEPDSANPVQEHLTVLGGPAGRAAVTAARLGANTRMVGMRGTGPHAETLCAELAREGVDYAFHVADRPSQHSVVMVTTDPPHRMILGIPAGPARTSLLDTIPDEVKDATVALVDCTSESITRAVVEEADMHGVPVVLDPGSYKRWVMAVLPDVAHVIVPVGFANHAGWNPDELHTVRAQYGCTVLAVTNGANGGWYSTVDEPDATFTWDTPTGMTAVDTCGAGDTFHGAYAWAVANGFPAHEAIQTGRWAAAMKTTRLGNATIPSLARLHGHITQHARDHSNG